MQHFFWHKQTVWNGLCFEICSASQPLLALLGLSLECTALCLLSLARTHDLTPISLNNKYMWMDKADTKQSLFALTFSPRLVCSYFLQLTFPSSSHFLSYCLEGACQHLSHLALTAIVRCWPLKEA